jgi:hypothetical protein
MVLNLKHVIAAGVVGLALMGAGQAGAAVYNIDATDGLGTELVLGVGSYRFEFIGAADGGAYDSANVTCASGPCTSGWTNGVSLRDGGFATAFLPGGSTTVDILSVGAIGSTHASALASLAAYQAGPIGHYGVDINAGVVSPPQLGETFPSSPFTFQSTVADIYRLVVTDLDGNRLNNQGGVSIRITAVPEPASWALMIGGFGLAGAALRRQRRDGLRA